MNRTLSTSTSKRPARCFIFTGGSAPTLELLTDLPTEDDYVIAADSGCDTLLRVRAVCPTLSPHLILGDMDSFAREKLSALFPQVPFCSFPPEKDDTDTALAVDTALERGFYDLVIVGGTGGRLDHTLANVYLLEYIRDRGGKAILTDGRNRAYLAEKHTEIPQGKRRYLSLIPLDKTVFGVHIGGVYYPYDTERLERHRFITVSNRITADRAVIDIADGNALIVESADPPTDKEV